MEDLVTSELGGVWSDDASVDLGNFSINSLDMNNRSSLSLHHHHQDLEAGHQRQKLKVAKF